MLLYIFVFIFSFGLTYFVKIIAKRKSLIDIPNERSSHVIPTPRGGGIAIAGTWFATISYLFYINKIESNLYFALMSGLLISGVSFIDDIYNLKSLPRLIIQALATVIALYFVGGLIKIDFGFFVFENKIILTAFAFIGVIWFINLFNFIDGIDGYASSEAIFVTLAMAGLLGDKVLLILALAVLGFLPWNWQKAKIFMGDVGSTLLGFTIAVFAIYYQNNNSSSIIIWLMLTSLFWFDATFTLYRRYRNNEKLSQAHRKHAYQRITQAGFSHQRTVIYSICINIVFYGLTIFAYYKPTYLIGCFIINLGLLFYINKLIDTKKTFSLK